MDVQTPPFETYLPSLQIAAPAQPQVCLLYTSFPDLYIHLGGALRARLHTDHGRVDIPDAPETVTPPGFGLIAEHRAHIQQVFLQLQALSLIHI